MPRPGSGPPRQATRHPECVGTNSYFELNRCPDGNDDFCRIHKTLRVTPAMEAGLTGHVWEIEEIVALLD